MLIIRTPMLTPVAIEDLRPTQITVGLREVESRRRRWRENANLEKSDFFAKHMIPVILGPKKRCYVLDHHHLCRALHEEGVKEVLVTVGADLSKLDKEAFWVFLDNRGWMHPFDDKGRRQPYDEIPTSIDAMTDDPFRSLAGELRRLGGFAKDTTPFSEFLWADFLRRRMKRKVVEAEFDKALETALSLAKSEAADYLPGWCGAFSR
jgi:hypothetical protein